MTNDQKPKQESPQNDSAQDLLLSIRNKVPLENCISQSEAFSTKIFAGVFINSDMKVLLDRCKQWNIDTASASCLLQQINKEEKHYLGLFLDDPHPSLHELEKAFLTIKEHLLTYFPDYETEHSKIEVFAQLFLH
jgi:hypothetical protein